jgi:hypothetical protein
MDIQTRKITFIQEFLDLQNEEIIRELEDFLKEKKIQLSENELKPMSIEQFDSEIDKSLEDSENDKVITASDLKAKIEKWA